MVDRSSQFLSYLMQPTNRLVNNLDIALVALVGGARALSGAISVGDVVSFIGYAQQFGGQTMQLSQVVTQILQASAGGSRVFEIIDREPMIADSPTARPLTRPTARWISTTSISATPRTNRSSSTTTSTSSRGQWSVSSGPPGPASRRSSTCSPGSTTSSRVRSAVDDINIVDIQLDSLRQRCGVVLQVPFLFTESVMYNLQYGREGATREECVAAAEQAHAHGFIQRLPDGYDTVLASGGENLSEGQRQL